MAPKNNALRWVSGRGCKGLFPNTEENQFVQVMSDKKIRVFAVENLDGDADLEFRGKQWDLTVIDAYPVRKIPDSAIPVWDKDTLDDFLNLAVEQIEDCLGEAEAAGGVGDTAHNSASCDENRGGGRQEAPKLIKYVKGNFKNFEKAMGIWIDDHKKVGLLPLVSDFLEALPAAVQGDVISDSTGDITIENAMAFLKAQDVGSKEAELFSVFVNMMEYSTSSTANLRDHFGHVKNLAADAKKATVVKENKRRGSILDIDISLAGPSSATAEEDGGVYKGCFPEVWWGFYLLFTLQIADADRKNIRAMTNGDWKPSSAKKALLRYFDQEGGAAKKTDNVRKGKGKGKKGKGWRDPCRDGGSCKNFSKTHRESFYHPKPYAAPEKNGDNPQ
jgi:hypothetical protein